MSRQVYGASDLAIVIPAFNEEETLAAVLVSASSFGQPIVVDDGSTDETAKIATNRGAVLVEHSENQGYDHALLSGIEKAISLGFDYVITLDADGQHDPTVLGEFLDRLESGFDMVIGVRGSVQRLSESVFQFVGSLLWSIEDPLCGVKGYRIPFLEKNVRAFKTYDSIGTEIAIRASILGADIDQVPILVRDRKGSSRFGWGLRTELRVLRAMFNGVLLTINLRLHRFRN